MGMISPISFNIAFSGKKHGKTLSEKSVDLVKSTEKFVDTRSSFNKRDRETIDIVARNIAIATQLLGNTCFKPHKLDKSAMPAVEKIFDSISKMPESVHGLYVKSDKGDFGDSILLPTTRDNWIKYKWANKLPVKVSLNGVTRNGEHFGYLFDLDRNGKIQEPMSDMSADRPVSTKTIPEIQDMLTDLARRLDNPELIKN